jgi:hypothetical protein
MLLTDFRGHATAVIGATPADVFSAITADVHPGPARQMAEAGPRSHL